MASEGNVQRSIWIAMGAVSRLFRLNTGKGWVSNLGPKKGVHRLADGSIHILAPRSIALGFGLVSGEPVVGACDLPGWTSIVITPEMVGRTLAVFTSVEAKKTEGGEVSKEQKNWMEQVIGAGGIAGIAASPEEALKIVADWKATPPLNL